MNLWPVFIPTKGRARKANLWPELGTVAIIEPHEAAEYKEHAAINLEETFTLSESHRGISYARNTIMGICSGWYWMLDDDITAFGVVKGRKVVSAPAREVLIEAQRQAVALGVTQVGLEYTQFAWAATKAHTLNRPCLVAQATNGDATRAICYRDEVNLKEDIDFSLQIMALGYKTARLHLLAFGTAKMASNAGGLHEEYKARRDEQAARKMCELWPNCCTLKQKKERIDLKVDTSIFNG